MPEQAPMTGLRIVFRCDAGRDDGLGHVMRSLVLAGAFAQRGAEVMFVTAEGPDLVGVARAAARGFVVRSAPGRIGTAADRAAIADLWGCAADLIVVDGNAADEAYLRACRSQRPVLAIDDDAAGGKPVDLLVNNLVDALPSFYGERSAGQLLLGPSFNLIDPAYFAARRSVSDRVARVLVTLGGEDPGNHTVWVLEEIARHQPALAFDVVLGPAHPAPDSVRSAVKRLPNAVLAEAPVSLVGLVSQADLAVSAAGTTLYELAAAGVPALAIAIEDHQRGLVDPLAAAGACAFMGDHRSLDPAVARALFQRAAGDAEFRRAMQRLQIALFPAPGAARIVDAASKLLKTRRTAA